MSTYEKYLSWIDGQQSTMCDMLWNWANINSGSMNLSGLTTMCTTLEAAFRILEGETEVLSLLPLQQVNSQGELVEVPLGKALRIRKRPDAPIKVFLGGHMDTVFSVDHPFQKVTEVDNNTWNGPGVSDLKGGLLVILKALEALERSPFAETIGWEVLINPDEEIGTYGSAPLFTEAAQRNDFGLIYEPSIDDQGTLAGQRKGAGRFSAVVRGKAAHSGREFHLGRNAICALSKFILKINQLNDENPNIILNVGNIEGGGAVNIVPDLAICRFGVRTSEPDDELWMHQKLETISQSINEMDGISLELHGSFNRKPKVMNDATTALFQYAKACGNELGQTIQWKATGGCCDGNNLFAAGLPNVDTLGVRGGKIHSDQEYILLNSLKERARLTALMLMKLGAGELTCQEMLSQKSS